MARLDEDEGRAPQDGDEHSEGGGSDALRSEGSGRSGQEKADEEKKPSPLKKPWVKGLHVVLAGGGIWGFSYGTVGRFIQETNDASVQADQVAISPQVSGYVATARLWRRIRS